MQSAKQPSVSARAAKLVDAMVADADALRISVSTGSHGERIIDLGANVVGGLEAGRRLGEICMGGLGTVAVALLWMKLFPTLRRVERLE